MQLKKLNELGWYKLINCPKGTVTFAKDDRYSFVIIDQDYFTDSSFTKKVKNKRYIIMDTEKESDDNKYGVVFTTTGFITLPKLKSLFKLLNIN